MLTCKRNTKPRMRNPLRRSRTRKKQVLALKMTLSLSSSGTERLRKQVEKKYMKNARDINSNDSEEDEEDDEDMDEEEISNDSGFASIRGEYETGDPFFIINRP